MTEKKSSGVSNFGYKIFETWGSQLIQLVISIVLARFLLPEDYGVVAIASTLIAILNSVVQSSFNTALVQKKELNIVDQSTAFYTMLLISSAMYLCLFFISPWIAKIYGIPELKLIIRVMSATLIIGSWVSIQIALISRNLKFRISFFVNLLGIILQGAVGIVMAINGFGVWSLVFSNVVYQLVIAVLYGFCTKWHPVFAFSKKSVLSIWKIGLPLCGAELVNIISSNIYPLIIGYFYPKDELGLYQKGSSTPTTIINGTVVAANSVFLPMMSKLQDDLDKVKEMLRQGLRISSFLIVPVALGLLGISREFIYVVLGEQWEGAISFMQITCVMLALYPLRIKLQAIKSIGKANQSLVSNIVHAATSCLLLFICIRVSVHLAVISLVISELCYAVVSGYFVYKDFSYSIKEQLSDILPTFLIGALMCLVVLILEKIFISPSVFALVVKIISGIGVYVLVSIIVKPKAFKEILAFLKIRKL